MTEPVGISSPAPITGISSSTLDNPESGVHGKITIGLVYRQNRRVSRICAGSTDLAIGSRIDLNAESGCITDGYFKPCRSRWKAYAMGRGGRSNRDDRLRL